MTNNLDVRLVEHYRNSLHHKKHFTSKYNCYFCVWFEAYKTPREAIKSENRLKRLSRIDKNQIIEKLNPDWKFFNQEILTKWPPDEWMLKWMIRNE